MPGPGVVVCFAVRLSAEFLISIIVTRGGLWTDSESLSLISNHFDLQISLAARPGPGSTDTEIQMDMMIRRHSISAVFSIGV